MSFKKFVKSLSEGDVEKELVRDIFLSLVFSAIVFAIFYYFKLRLIENFMPKYGAYIIMAIISYSFIIPVVKQVKSYKTFPCMSGMMIGMTLGMVAGFLSGYYVGATNGMFWGSVFGMLIGIIIGIWSGSCCGIMGMMEGIMAGFMGGLMGAMTAVMMLNDNMLVGGLIMLIICGIILTMLSYMVYIESREKERQQKDNIIFTVGLSLLLSAITIVMIIFGPRSVLFS